MNTYTIILFFILILLITLLKYISKTQKKEQLTNVFKTTILLLFLQCFCVFLQGILSNYIDTSALYYIEYVTYIANVFLPVSFLFTGLIFANTKINIQKKHFVVFIIPILSLIMLWTNKYHNLFYVNYSMNYNETIYGTYFNYIHTPYSYILIAIGFIYLIKYSIKNAGFFSAQSTLLCIGSSIPVVVNILGVYNIVPMSIYATPISFTITILFYTFAIFKFKFLSVTPIAMQRIVDRMSDSFLVVNEDGVITDFNDTFLKTFKLSSSAVRNANFISFLASSKLEEMHSNFVKSILEKCKSTEETILVKRELKIRDKYFNVEASGIFSKNSFLGTLVLLKDITQHIIDRNTIEDNQSMLMEKERLASLGQMIGGIAHNLKTPIMSIAGAAEGLTDLTKEYDISIGDTSVTNEDHHEIVKDMNTWIEKIKTHTAYMSEVITAVKGQAVAFTETNSDTFTISELLAHVDVLMKHELKNALIELNTSVLVPTSLSIKGNINSLVQVVNNIISNAIQSYKGKTNKNIDFIIKLKDNNLIFSVKDYGCGMSQKVQNKLFKEMITTKGKNGTGLGLFMSYSNIKAHFNGDITFDSTEGKGTTFNIIVPINQ